jgi:hypothetical protein
MMKSALYKLNENLIYNVIKADGKGAFYDVKEGMEMLDL